MYTSSPEWEEFITEFERDFPNAEEEFPDANKVQVWAAERDCHCFLDFHAKDYPFTGGRLIQGFIFVRKGTDFLLAGDYGGPAFGYCHSSDF